MVWGNRLQFIVFTVVGLISNLGLLYSISALSILFGFLYLRVPYLYGMAGFMLFIFVLVSPMFLSLFIGRLEAGLNDFFSSLLPPGTPLWIAPFVGLAETISYIVRPVVLMIRPFLNITIGALGGASLGSMFMSNYTLLVVLAFLFLYEVFVAIVHWFIVVNILGFTIDH